MGKRREPRQPLQAAVRIFGTDRNGKVFSETVNTADVSQSGAKLTGVQTRLKVEDTIGLTYRSNKAKFRVRWIGPEGTPAEGKAGLLNLTPASPLWEIPLPSVSNDDFRAAAAGERRRSMRVRCEASVELRPPGQAVIRAKASELSIGGCFVEMPTPLKPDSKLEISLWLGGTKLRLQGSVASVAPGFGIGVRFLEVSPQDRELLAAFVQAQKR